jgi:hypothetical protein
MSRVLCTLILASSVALLAFGPTAVFANPPCSVINCYNGNSQHKIKEGDTCDNGCTQKNHGGHCFHTVDNHCSK